MCGIHDIAPKTGGRESEPADAGQLVRRVVERIRCRQRRTPMTTTVSAPKYAVRLRRTGAGRGRGCNREGCVARGQLSEHPSRQVAPGTERPTTVSGDAHELPGVIEMRRA